MEGVLRYQDLKIRDAARLAAIAGGSAVVFVLVLYFRSVLEPLADHSLRRFGGYIFLMALPVGIGLFCAWLCVTYLRTSPAQNREFIDRAAARGRSLPKTFDAALFDPSDPDYDVTTFVYLCRKLVSRRNG